MDQYRIFDKICVTGIATSGYTSGLCGVWTKERFQTLAGLFNTDCRNMIVADQKHTDSIFVAGKDDAGMGIISPHTGEPFDAVITSKPGLMLSVHTADCVPIAMLDPVKKAIGIVHSGWVGSAKNIAGKTIRKMKEVFQSDPGDIICCIGPYNHACCYEVGEDVLDAFRDSFTQDECSRLFKPADISENTTAPKYMLDLGMAVSLSLTREGVKSESIFDSGHCTYHTTDFSSWRRTKDKKHQILSFIMLNG